MSESIPNPQSLEDKLRQEILQARQRVYRIAKPTPLEKIHSHLPGHLYIKREDQSPIRAYKWRGAYNRMATLSDAEKEKGIVTASAGNHAQGVALAARKLDTFARIFMPRSTPKIKQASVLKFGGKHAEIILNGDSYDQALEAALSEADEQDKPYIHAYDDIHVMAGQGTLADEIVMSGEPPFDLAYLQIGGGGLAASVACWLKLNYPKIRIIGVEGIGQATMKSAIENKMPVDLESVDIFCDGTAVRQAGKLTYALCSKFIDRFVTVTNEEVCEALRFLWENHRCLPEPSGAMGIAGYLKNADTHKDQRVLTILTGANIDFGQLSKIAASTGVGTSRRRFISIQIPEQSGSMLRLLKNYLQSFNILEFQYGKTHASQAAPVFGIATNDLGFQALLDLLKENNIKHKDLTTDDDVHFRIIPYKPELMNHPVFMKLEFYERPGALYDFLSQTVQNKANICYFNYTYSGERVGHALLGFEFPDLAAQKNFLDNIPQNGQGYRSCQPINPNALQRILC